MPAEWENTLMEIERGNADADAFLSGIVRMTGDLVKAYPFLSDAEAQRFLIVSLTRLVSLSPVPSALHGIITASMHMAAASLDR